MIMSLAILRGVNLMAMDTNLIAANSSDPYCEVYVNDQKIGWTPTQTATLNPVWGCPMSTYRIEGGGGTKIVIKLFDRDELSADDPMGTVSFYVRDLMERKYKDKYPNFWATVEPPKGYEGQPAGRLEIRLLKESEDAKKDSLARPVSLSKEHVTISSGPRLSDIPTNDSLPKVIVSAKTPVILHVYDVGNNHAKIRALNSALPYTGMGGIFHGAIEIFGREYSFGGSRRRVCGVFAGDPAGCPMHTYRESIYLGDCGLNRHQVVAILKRMKPEWMAPTYDLLRKNCCTFSNELAIELGVGGIPSWVHALANTGAALETMMGWENNTESMHHRHELRTTWRSLDTKELDSRTFEDMTFEYVMAVRLQRAFRARHPKKETSPETEEEHSGFVRIRRATVNKYDGHGFETSEVQIRRATVNAYGGQGFEVDK